MIKITTIKTFNLAALAGLGLLLGGCTTPDLKPLADSTASLHQAVVQSQKIVKTELDGLKDAKNLRDANAIANDAAKIDKMFETRKAFTQALVGYSDSLASVADAAKNGQANAQALGDSVKKLASAAGPYGDAVGAGSTIVSQVYALAVQAWAVHDLKEAVSKVDPAIRAGALFLQMDMTNVIDILEFSKREAVAAAKFDYFDEIRLYGVALDKRKSLNAELTAALNSTNTTADLTAYNLKAVELDKVLARLKGPLDPMNQRISVSNARFDSEIEIAKSTIEGFQQLAKVHADLKKTLEENRQVNVRELVSTVLEINDEIQKLKQTSN